MGPSFEAVNTVIHGNVVAMCNQLQIPSSALLNVSCNNTLVTPSFSKADYLEQVNRRFFYYFLKKLFVG